MVSVVSRHRKYLERPQVGELCTLRDATFDDVEHIVACRNASRMGFFDARLITAEGTRHFLKNADGWHFVIEHDGQPCGYVSIHGIDEETGLATVGRSMLCPEYRGKGIMGEARHLSMAYAFLHAPIRKICGTTRQDNPHGLKFALSVGQEFEGIRYYHFGADQISGVVHGCFRDRYLEDFDSQARCYRHPSLLSETIRRFLGL